MTESRVNRSYLGFGLAEGVSAGLVAGVSSSVQEDVLMFVTVVLFHGQKNQRS